MIAARIQLAWLDRWYEGETPCEIMEKVEEIQNFGCMISMGRQEENKSGQKQLDKLEAFLDRYYQGELTIEDLKGLNVILSIGVIKCHEIVEGKENVDKVMGR